VTARRESTATLLYAAGLVALTLVVYARTLGFDFAKVDDSVYVTKNPHVMAGLNGADVAWALTSFENSNWHPLTWISLMADASIGGGKPWAFHATNVVLHVANVLLLFLILLDMTGAAGASAFVAAVFAVHPFHVESVAWITERKDVLSTLFWWLAIAAYLGWVRRPSRGRYAAVAAAFIAGAMSKPMVVTLPFTLLLIDFWPLGRLRGVGPLVEKAPLFAIAAASSIVTLIAQKYGMAPLSALPIPARLATAVVAYALYAVKTVWPYGLSIHTSFALPLPAGAVAASAIALAGATVAAWAARRQRPYVTFGWLWFVGTLVPVIGLVQVGEQSMADRYTYVPMVGLLVIVAWGVSELLPRRAPLAVASAVVLAAATAAAWRQVGTWRNAYELFSHAVAVDGRNALTRMGFAQELALRGRDAEAIDQYRIAIALRPNALFAHQHLAECLERTGKLGEAAKEFGAMLRIDSQNAEAELGLGVILLQENDPARAAKALGRAVAEAPDDPRMRATLGLALTRLEREEEAEAAFGEALRLDPDNVIAHKGIAVVLAARGRTDEAIAHLRRALALDPRQADARENLDRLLRAKGM
jgi:Flp pilus assembly protein TadD